MKPDEQQDAGSRHARTVGIDLAADASKSAVAVLEWTPNGAEVRSLDRPAADSLLVDRAMGAAKIGIDCPFGWPVAFIEFVTRHRDATVGVPTDSVLSRRPLVYRATDLYCLQHGLRPLSVAADLIAHVAMRCAALLPQLDDNRDRSGRGRLVEAYPAASLSRWGLVHRRYKGPVNVVALGSAVDALRAGAPWLRLGGYEALCRRDDDAFDAVIAALSARAAMLGLVEAPPDEMLELARVEGWIALPTCQLAELVG